MDQARIEKVQYKDAADLKEIMLLALQTDPTAFSVDYHEYAIGGDEWWRNYLSDYCAGMYAHMYFLKQDDTIIGSGGIIFNRKNRLRHVASIVWIYIKKDFRGQGFSKKILDHIINTIKEDPSILKISLTVVAEQKEAINLYEKYGFKIAGRQEKELKIENKFYDFLIMEKIIR